MRPQGDPTDVLARAILLHVSARAGKKKPGIVDVAREAGVSVGAASDALAGKNRLPDETRRRVREAAERLGYRPDPAARALRTGRAPVLGLVLTSLRRVGAFEPYEALWGWIVAAATLAAHERGYVVCVLPDLEIGSVPSVPLSGLIVIDADMSTPDLQAALAFDIPFVLPVDSAGDSPASVSVVFDDEVIARDALDHLWDQGCRRIGTLLLGFPDQPDALHGAFLPAERAYRTWCAARGVEPVVLRFGSDEGDADRAAQQLFASGVDGVYTVAPGGFAVMRAAFRHGIVLGETLRMVTRSVGSDGAFAAAGISTMSVSLRKVLDESIGALVDVVEGRTTAPVVLEYPFELSVRASSGGVAL